MNNVQLTTQLFLQLAVILACCRATSLVAAKFGQPPVVAQMIAGVMLGPSLLGWLAPAWKDWLFPLSMPGASGEIPNHLYTISQLGLALYMFVVGIEFRIDILKRHWKASAAVSIGGMIAPFVLGAALGWYCQRHTALFTPETSPVEAMLFLGASLCITAFPMLARIIHFKNLQGTKMGTVAIGAGALGDAGAWCLLAIVVASFKSQPRDPIVQIANGVAFVIVSIALIRPLLQKFEWVFGVGNRLTERGLVWGIALMALGAWITDSLGFHVVFGAFVMGAIMPRSFISRDLVVRIEPFTVAVLLPLFFTYSGLNTRVQLLASMDLAVAFLAILVAAIAGKGVACYLAARWSGGTRREALGIGILMNARGLMELIVIDIGLERGLITPGLFSALMLMAIVTTLMTSPLFERFAAARSSAAFDSVHDSSNSCLARTRSNAAEGEAFEVGVLQRV